HCHWAELVHAGSAGSTAGPGRAAGGSAFAGRVGAQDRYVRRPGRCLATAGRHRLDAAPEPGSDPVRYARLLENSMKIAVVGTGYVGLVTGTCFADCGNEVVCVDKDAAKIAMLERGEMPIYEPGLNELVLRNKRDGRLKF